jgi:hypothetical protein
MKLLLLLKAAVLALVPADADLTSLGELLKEVYDPIIAEQQNLEPFTWREFDENEGDELGGKGWVFDTKQGGNQEGIGARIEKATLPTAGHQRWEQGLVVPKYHYGTFELTGQIIMAAQKNVQAFANARTDEMESLTKDVIKDLNRVIYGDGTGVLCTVKSDEASSQFDTADGMYLRLNQVFTCYTAGTDTVVDTAAGLTITALTPQADGDMRVTYSGADKTLVATNEIVRTGLRADGTAGAIDTEIDGFKVAIDDGTVATTYHGISRTTYPLWSGNVLDNAGTNRNISLDLHQQAEDAIVEMGGMRPDWMRMNLGQRRKFFDLVAPDRRFDSTTFDAGFERLSYNGIQITVDIDHPKNEITYITKSKFKKYTLRPLGILDLDGQTLRQVVGQDLWRGHLGLYANFCTKRPNCHARIIDLQEPTTEQRARG